MDGILISPGWWPENSTKLFQLASSSKFEKTIELDDSIIQKKLRAVIYFIPAENQFAQKVKNLSETLWLENMVYYSESTIIEIGNYDFKSEK